MAFFSQGRGMMGLATSVLTVLWGSFVAVLFLAAIRFDLARLKNLNRARGRSRTLSRTAIAAGALSLPGLIGGFVGLSLLGFVVARNLVLWSRCHEH